MHITKFVHACLVVETPDRIAVFDPGVMSEQALHLDLLSQVDDIIITHSHGDHFSRNLVKALVEKFPNVRITAPSDVVAALAEEGIAASDQPSDGIIFFDSPHESVEPMFPTPQQIGVHYLDQFTHPGDSHSFHETKAVLALPITAPWGSSVRALNLALNMRPQYVIPIHDWHWREEARQQTYDTFEKILAEHNIIFLKPETGVALEVNT